MEHLDPRLNNDCLDEIERAKGKAARGERQAQEQKVNVCEREGKCVCVHMPDTHRGREDV